MKNYIPFCFAIIIFTALLSCNGSQPATENKKEETTTETKGNSMKTAKVKIIIEEDLALDFKIDPKSILAGINAESSTLVLGNLRSPSYLILRDSEVMMTTIAMQEARTPAPVIYPASAEGKAAVIQCGLFQGALYQASVLCICDQPLSDSLMADLKSGKVFLDDICKKPQ